MSGSPKYTYAQLRQMELEEERRHRREQAAREAEQRRLEIERQERMRLERSREEAARYAHVVATELVALFTMPLCEYISREVVTELEQATKQAAARAAAASNETDGRAAGRTLQQVLDRVRRHTAQATQLHDRRVGLLSELDRAEAEIRAARGGELAPFLEEDTTDRVMAQLRDLRDQLTAIRAADAVRTAGEGCVTLQGGITQLVGRATTLRKQAIDIRDGLARVRSEFEELTASNLAGHLEPEAVAKLQNRLTELDRSLSQIAQPEDVAILVVALGQGRAELRRLTEAARSAMLAAHLAEEEQGLARLKGELAAMDPGLSHKFDEEGFVVVQTAIREAEALLAHRELVRGREKLSQARQRLGEHAESVAKLNEAWQQRWQQAQRAASAVTTELMSLREDQQRVRYVAHSLDGLDGSLRQLQTHIQAEQFDEAVAVSRHLIVEIRRLAALASECHVEAEESQAIRVGVQAAQPTGRGFDPRGAAELARLLDVADAALKRGAVADARETLNKARERLGLHRQAVAAELTRWQAEYDRADKSLSHAAIKLDALKTDEVAMRWNRAAVEAISSRLDHARRALAAGRFADVHAATDNAPAELDHFVAAAQPLELQARLQRRMVTGVTQVMSGLGYEVRGPHIEQPDDPRSALVMQAARVSGERIAVTVEHEGRIEYDVGGTLGKQEETIQVGSLRRPVKTCDEAEKQLLALHQLLLELGIETDGLHWEGQGPPDRSTGIQLPTTWHHKNTDAAQRPNPNG
jgi:hypothetical protein